MGFLDSILGKKTGTAPEAETKSVPMVAPQKSGETVLYVNTELKPLRLTAMQKSKVYLLVTVKNTSSETQMVSVDINIPGGALLGFDEMTLKKKAEKRINEIQPGETKEIPVVIYSSNQTKAGSYPIDMGIYTHYQTFEKVLTSANRRVVLRVA
ncbi:MAG: hypothetical protein ACP5NX_00065 [Candidatus Bilamarchaeaceae archaeon]